MLLQFTIRQYNTTKLVLILGTTCQLADNTLVLMPKNLLSVFERTEHLQYNSANCILYPVYEH